MRKSSTASLLRSPELRGATIGVLVTLLLSVGISILVAVDLGTVILRSLRSIGNVTDKLSQGDLGQAPAKPTAQATAADASGLIEKQIDTERADEIGDLARSFTRVVSYLGEMAAVSESIASGDLSQNVEPQGERDILGHAFRRMTQQLGELVHQVRNSASEVASASMQVAHASAESARISVQAASSIDEVVSTMHEINANVHNVVRNTQAQAGSVSETSASIEQMIASIQRVAEMSNLLVQIAGNSRNEVQAGITSMDRATRA
jgi:methyl-accepting chemotaxis protein